MVGEKNDLFYLLKVINPFLYLTLDIIQIKNTMLIRLLSDHKQHGGFPRNKCAKFGFSLL